MTKKICEHRIISDYQSKGSLGKSTFKLGLLPWFEKNSIQWQGFDLDETHKSFSKRYPSVENIDLRSDPIDKFMRMFTSFENAPVSIVDSRAQVTDTYLSAIRKTNFIEISEQKNIRLTVLLFPADLEGNMESFQKIVKEFQFAVDYLIVKTSFSKSNAFDGSNLEKLLLDKLNAKVIQLPTLENIVFEKWKKIESQEGRGVTLTELAVPDNKFGFDGVIQGNVQMYLNELSDQFNDSKEYLLDSVSLQNFKKSPAAKKKVAQSDEELDLSTNF